MCLVHRIKLDIRIFVLFDKSSWAGCSKNGLRSELVKKEQNIHFCGS